MWKLLRCVSFDCPVNRVNAWSNYVSRHGQLYFSPDRATIECFVATRVCYMCDLVTWCSLQLKPIMRLSSVVVYFGIESIFSYWWVFDLKFHFRHTTKLVCVHRLFDRFSLVNCDVDMCSLFATEVDFYGRLNSKQKMFIKQQHKHYWSWGLR